MGGSSWSDDLYRDRAAYRSSVGAATFSHDDDIKRGRVGVKAHDKLNGCEATCVTGGGRYYVTKS